MVLSTVIIHYDNCLSSVGHVAPAVTYLENGLNPDESRPEHGCYVVVSITTCRVSHCHDLLSSATLHPRSKQNWLEIYSPSAEPTREVLEKKNRCDEKFERL